ncbi:methyltransferase family protein [Kitasatospora sp. NPDC051705]|uniref:methyltransferase family protein n=1 Tax=Kitasatospora sp. NPDC051705 TaxID=3364057 RepID=UPI0037AE5C1C
MAEEPWATGSLHSATVALTYTCVAIFCAAWTAGVLYFAVAARSGLRGWLRGLRRSMLRRLLLVGGGYALFALLDRTRDFWQHLRYWQPVLAVAGALLAVASTALLLWARWVLGAMWASVPTVQERHELRTDGPYRLVRHPIYTGLLGLIAGGMAACGFGVWIAYILVAVPWLLLRVRAEDAMMAGRFGAAYETYRARVPALVPLGLPAASGPAGPRRR